MLDEDRIRRMVRRVVHRTLGIPPPVPEGGKRLLVTEAELQDAPVGGEVVIPSHAIVTPLARQIAMERQISLVAAPTPPQALPSQPQSAGSRPVSAQVIALGADHGGYPLKEVLKPYLGELGYQVVDCGTHSTDPVDYPDIALAVAQLVAQNRAWRGIVVDGAGIGSCMAANKVPGIRAAMCYDQATAVNSREHNDANVLTLGAGLTGPTLARQITKVWLETPSGGGRHARRVERIMEIERRFSR